MEVVFWGMVWSILIFSGYLDKVMAEEFIFRQ